MLKTAVETFRRTKGVRSLLALRNEILYRQFLGNAASRGHAFADALRAGPERNYCFTIAFNTPWVIDVLTKAWQVFPTGTSLVVVDNSSRKETRPAIEAICRQRGVAYFPLPRNFEPNPSRSHGVSQTWAFHNIIKQLRPDMFGFIDHDCFPTKPFDILRRIEGKIGYGAMVRPRSTYLYQKSEDEIGWYYWAGFCFYDFRAVEQLKLDFRSRVDIGMDTGGGNWPAVYSRYPAARFEHAERKSVTVDLRGRTASYQIIDQAFLHIGGASYRSNATNPDYRRSLSDHIWETYLGGTKDRLVSG